MTRIRIVLSLLLLAISQEVFAAPREKVVAPFIRTLAAPADAKDDMARYSLRAYGNCDPANVVQALLFTPKPVGMVPLPMVVYIPGKGEIGDIARQFRHREIFDRVTSSAFQEKYPCFLLALAPPAEATTLMGGVHGVRPHGSTQSCNIDSDLSSQLPKISAQEDRAQQETIHPLRHQCQ